MSIIQSNRIYIVYMGILQPEVLHITPSVMLPFYKLGHATDWVPVDYILSSYCVEFSSIISELVIVQSNSSREVRPVEPLRHTARVSQSVTEAAVQGRQGVLEWV